MSNATNSKAGGFGLGPVVVVGLICFILGYLAASFAPVLTGSKINTSRSSTVSTAPRTDENAGRHRVPEETPADATAAEEPEVEKPAAPEPEKAPTP